MGREINEIVDGISRLWYYYLVIYEEMRLVMIVLKLKLHNLYNFSNFSIDMSFPKRIINSTLGEETLPGRHGFRYKKVIILMGSNATGKTCLGRAIKNICDFINESNPAFIHSMVCDKSKEAFLQVDFINLDNILSRLTIKVSNRGLDYALSEAHIGVKDTYEKAAARLEPVHVADIFSLIEHTGKIDYIFRFSETERKMAAGKTEPKIFLKVLRAVLTTLDPTLGNVRIAEGLTNSYIIKKTDSEIIIQDGKLLNKELLSSGTIEGVDIALFLASMLGEGRNLYYCDEHFSYVQTEIEKRLFQLMVGKLKDGEQLFFTTHNMDMLDLNLPKHAFALLRREENGSPSVAFVSELLKRSTDSVRCAVENDAFSSLPDLSALDRICETE